MDVLGSRPYGLCGRKAALKKNPRRGLKRTVDLGCLIAGWIALLLSCSITLAFLDAAFVTVPHKCSKSKLRSPQVASHRQGPHLNVYYSGGGFSFLVLYVHGGEMAY